MIKMTIDVQTRPHKSKEFLQILEHLIKEFRKEEGNLEYKYQLEGSRRNQVHIMTEWKNWYTLESHFQSKFFETLFGAIRVLCEKPDVKIENGSTTKGIDTINKLQKKH